MRCTIQDAAINVFGPRLRAVWGPQEKQVGHGFAGVPIDNVGVQYGLGALRSGKINAAQFVDLNVKIGGLDADASPVPNRMTADRPRAGQRLPQRDDQRDQQPRPHGDHRLPRTRRGRSSTTPTGRSPCGHGSTASTAATPTS